MTFPPSGLFTALMLAAAVTQVPGNSEPQASPRPQVTVDVLFSLKGTKADYDIGIAALRKADVAKDVSTAKRRKDRRLVAMWGYSLEVPGVEGIPPGDPPPGFKIVVVKGTSDATMSDAQRTFQSLLTKYADQYNRGLLER
jgi:hypothetical protein